MNATLRILGSGPSTGVPIPACGCAVCRSGSPRNERLRSSALISTPRASVLIDTSPDLRQQALRHGLSDVSAVLFTHSHADHILGFDDLRSFNFVRRHAIPCYGTALTLRDLQRTFYYLVDPPPEYKGGMLAKVTFHEIEPEQRFAVAGLRMQAFQLLHGDAPVTGFRSGNLAYATDCSSLPEQAQRLLGGVEHFVIDGLREAPHATHFSIAQAIDAARAVGARRIYLTHLSHSVDYYRVSSMLPDGVALAFDGMSIDFEPDYSEEA